MAGSRRHIKIEETQYIRDIAQIMAAGTGPFTRTMLADELSKIYPHLSKKEVMQTVSAAIQCDRFINKRFMIARPGWWRLAEKNNP